MEEDIVGMLAVSKAGHDKDSVYVIIREDGEYIYVADGRSRTADRPKRKNKKHIQLIKKKKMVETENGFSDLEMKRVIREYLREREERNVKG
ncbi:MAG: KOW domain-containing RNA-binding protein [Lachnospiraceae bacterium]|nr:KOW domain-containing RNA-binding protein [Lachnospiraceae bacterium]